MFDDTKAPGNLPVGDAPEDIFGPIDAAPTPGQPPSSAVQRPPAAAGGNDPHSGGVRMRGGEFVDAPSALDAGKIRPKQSNPSPSMRPAAAPQSGAVSGDTGVVSASAQTPRTVGQDAAVIQESFVMRHKLLVGLAVVLAVVVLVLVGFTLFLSDSQRVAERVDRELSPPPSDAGGSPAPTVEPVAEPETDVVPEPELEPPVEQPIEQPVEEQGPPSASDDPDGDGLTTTQELLAGTNPQKSDTDNDGLTDKEELNIWNTDPLDADTDDDTFEDGEEVRHGYNPNGPGRLFGTPQQ